MRSLQYYCVIPLAYLYSAVEKLCTLPPYVYVGAFLLASTFATLTTLTAPNVAKFRLASSSQSLEEYARFLQYTQASGNDVLGQRVYENLLPSIQSQAIAVKEKFHEIVYPQERVEALLKFWSDVYAKQPNSREANAALAILAYQKFEDEKFQQYLKRWEELEPNDERLRIFKMK